MQDRLKNHISSKKYLRGWRIWLALGLMSVITAGAFSVANSASYPDYVVQNLLTAPENIVSGQAVSFSATIKNQGSGAASRLSKTRLRIDIGNNGSYDIVPAKLTTSALAVGATESETWQNVWVATAGTHKFQVCADVGKVITESNEKNNCTTQIFTVASETPPPNSSSTDSITPTVETDSFSGSGDIADDSLIWYNAADPAQSLIIGDNKATSGGIGVFNLSGQLTQFLPEGKIGNVDIRQGFPLGGGEVSLVAAANRTNWTLAFYQVNPVTLQLEPVATASTTSLFYEPYGLCMYKSPSSGKFYVFVTAKSTGTVEQWEVFDNSGKVDAVKVRSFNVGSQSEGCVTDDELGYFYVAEETKGIWKYNAEPSGGTSRTQVDTTATGGHLKADVEGLTIAYKPNGAGYLFASSQGDSTIAMYERGGNNTYVKNFSVQASGTIDAVTGTDGIDVTTTALGPAFPYGIFVIHDSSNSGGTTSNLKYVPLEKIIGTDPTP